VIVLDASTLIDVLLGQPYALDVLAEQAVGHEQEPLRAPELIEPETLSGLRKLVMRGQLAGARADEAVLGLRAIRCIRYPHAPFRDRVWELRHNLTPYDALYLALAEALEEATLLTGDSRLATQAAQTIGPDRVRHVRADQE
jgi:predicted nucleic acid-binding protein